MKKQKSNKFMKCMCYGLMVTMLLFAVGCGGASKYAADTAATESVTTTGSSNGSFNYYSYDDMAAEEAVEEEFAETDAEAPESTKAEKVEDTNRKLIKTVDLMVETQDFDGLMPLIEQKVASLGGYIETSDVYNGSNYRSYKDLRWASLTVRVPQNNLEEFISDVKVVSNVTNCNQRVEDVTLTYVDLESHKKALQTEQDRLLELLEVAETVDDIITIESRLSQVRYEIESMEAQLRSYDNRVNYSTVYMNIEEVEILTPVVEETAGQRIVRGFSESVADVLHGIKEFCIGFIISLPYLLVWGIIVAVVIVVIIKLIRRTERKAEQKKMFHNSVIKNIEKAEENDNKGI